MFANASVVKYFAENPTEMRVADELPRCVLDDMCTSQILAELTYVLLTNENCAGSRASTLYNIVKELNRRWS